VVGDTGEKTHTQNTKKKIMKPGSKTVFTWR
jgi:hypothetical protein